MNNIHEYRCPTQQLQHHLFGIKSSTSSDIPESQQDHHKPSIPVTHTVAMAVAHRTQDLTHHLHRIFLGVSSPKFGVGWVGWEVS